MRKHPPGSLISLSCMRPLCFGNVFHSWDFLSEVMPEKPEKQVPWGVSQPYYLFSEARKREYDSGFTFREESTLEPIHEYLVSSVLAPSSAMSNMM